MTIKAQKVRFNQETAVSKPEEEKVDVDQESSNSEHESDQERTLDDNDESSNIHMNRNERKARKILMKLGLKPVAGIERVAIKRSRNMIFAIPNPEVYKVPNSDSYIIFGEAKIEDPAAQAQAWAGQKLAQARAGNAEEDSSDSHSASHSFKRGGMSGGASGSGRLATAHDDEPEEDATGLDEKDIIIIMEQANVSRNKAIKALKENANDIVNTIMSLTN